MKQYESGTVKSKVSEKVLISPCTLHMTSTKMQREFTEYIRLETTKNNLVLFPSILIVGLLALIYS